MPSFADSIFLFVLALLLFGPKKLPVLARELGKWMGEFRRASNEFKMQMDEELRASEQADRQKQIVAMEAAAPVPPPLGEPEEPVHPHLRYTTAEEPASEAEAPAAPDRYTAPYTDQSGATADTPEPIATSAPPAPSLASSPTASTPAASSPTASSPATADGVRPIPIATSGSLQMMPPATGLPTSRSSRPNALSGLVDSLPEAHANGDAGNAQRQPEPTHSAAPESVVHGD